MRGMILTIAPAFIAALAVLPGFEIAKYGVTVVSVSAITVLLLFMVGIVGALRKPPRE